MAMRYPGGFISSTAPTVSANSAKGIWTLEEVMQYIRAGQWPVPTGNGDPYFQYNTMLLPGQGTNGAQNNTFLDSSTNNFTVNRSGNVPQGTFTPFSGTEGNWSNYFDGTGDYLTLPDSTALNLETGDFTIELWFYVTTSGVNNPLIYRFDGDASSRNELQFGMVYNSSGNLVFSAFQSTTNDDIPFTGVSINQWHHCALVRSGNNIYAYLDGVRNPTTRTLVGSLNNGGWQTWIGGYREGGTFQYLNGFISNVRILKGTALYTGSTYTVPTAPLTAITNTSLLTCQNNRFVDNSTNAFTLTANGNVAVTPFQPFGAPTVAYSASTIGGSGYFDGSGDYLTVGNDALLAPGTGDFTWEGWFYWIGGSGENVVWTLDATGGMNIGLAISSSQWGIGSRGVAVQNAFGTLTKNQWMYLAITRSGTTINAYYNGTRIFTGSNSYNYVSGGTLCLGSIATLGGQDFNGYMSGVRWTKGTALYTGSTMTIPTAPNTTTSGGASATTTELLLDFTNAGIIDNAQDNNLETVGGAQISTTQYKWGASSVAFDGTTDYLIPYGSTTNLLAFGSGAFTIEMWFYVTSFPSQYGVLYDCRPTSTNGSYPVISLENNGTAYFYVNTANAISSGSGVISTGRWYHLAVVKAGSSTKMFVNGNQVGSTYADTNTYLNPANRPAIGAEGFTLGNNSLNGYIQDLRITKGYARYPYNFTAPTAALPLFWQAAATPSADPYFEYTTLLLPGNGTNGAQNNTFLDSGTANGGVGFPVNRSGNTTQGTFTPFSQTGWSNSLASGGYLTFTGTSAFSLDGDFTLECWVYLNSYVGSSFNELSVFNNRSGLSTGTQIDIGNSASGNPGNVAFWHNGSTILSASSRTVQIGQWTHLAFVRSGTGVNNFKFYVNGVMTSQASSTATFFGSSGTFYIGQTIYDQPFNNTISNFRITKGGALYTSNFIPSTTPLTTTVASGTVSLLTCQSNRFIDNSASPVTLTPVTSPSVQAFSPFNPTAAYSTSTVGGSGYFDGSGDYLDAGSNAAFSFGTGAYTVECWVYPTSTANQAYVTNDTTNGSVFYYENATGFIIAPRASSGIVSGGAGKLIPNQWNHIVYCRASTSTNQTSIFANGARVANGTDSTNWTITGPCLLGGLANNTYMLSGYMGGVRIVKGTDVYGYNNTSITVPTAPLTAITNTSLLCNFTNGGIIDNTAKNNLETVGGASISTTVSKFGGSSMYFDGSGDWLLMPAGDKFAFGTGDYTVEAWVYFTSITTTDLQIIFLSGSTGGNNFYFHVDGNQISVGTSAAFISNQATSFSTATWYHVAACRYSGTLRLFVNGVQIGSSVSDTTNWISAGSARIGANESGTQTVFGYINDHRVTKGIARYTTNFTPPTTAFLTL